MDDKVKGLLGKLKSSASVIGEAAENTLKTAGKWTEETVEAAKLNIQIRDLGSEINALYKEIGEIVYKAHTGAEVGETEIQDKLKQIDEKNAAIEEIKDRIEAQKKIKSCPTCGEPCSKEDKFCKGCGQKLE